MKTYKHLYRDLLSQTQLREQSLLLKMVALERCIEEAEHTGWIEKSSMDEIMRKYDSLHDEMYDVKRDAE